MKKNRYMCIYNWEKKKKKSKQLRQILWIALPLREKTMFKSGFHFLTSQTVCVCVSVCVCVRARAHVHAQSLGHVQFFGR